MAEYEPVGEDQGFLGKGTFGVVEKVVRKADGQVFACKTIRFASDEKHRKPAQREYSILSVLDHPNIVEYIDIQWTRTSAKIYMAFCEGGSLAEFISQKKARGGEHVPEPYMLSVFAQLSAALRYCHYGINSIPTGSSRPILADRVIIHRDVKPGNVLLSTRDETEDVVVKLGDFGLSTFVDDEKAPSTYAGTKEYMAPEISGYRQDPNRWTKMCDVFSLGCTMYELGKLKPPFRGHMEEDDTVEPLPDHYSHKLRNRVVACMSYRPDRRPDASDLARSTEHVRSGGASNSLSQGKQAGSPRVQSLSKTPKTMNTGLAGNRTGSSSLQSSSKTPNTSDPTLAQTWHSPPSPVLHPRPLSQSSGTGSLNDHPDQRTSSSWSRVSVSMPIQEELRSTQQNNLKDMEERAAELCSHDEYMAAEKSYRLILEIQQNTWGTKHPDTLTGMNNLAVTLLRQEKYEAAEEMYRQALESHQKVLGPEHEDTLTCMHNLAVSLDKQGKHEAAEEMHRQALELDQKVLGTEHKDTLTCMHNLAVSLGKLYKYEAAEEMLSEALKLREKVLGRWHPITQGTKLRLKDLLKQKDKVAREPWIKRVLKNF